MAETLGPSNITQKQRWAAELRTKGFAILAPVEVRALLAIFQALPNLEHDVPELVAARETLRDAHQAKVRHDGA